MKVAIIVIFTFLGSSNLFSQETSAIHKEVLAKHLQAGQLNEEELNRQNFEYENSKKWNKEFKKQVRGVSSTIQKHRKIIKFKNPVIEISVE